MNVTIKCIFIDEGTSKSIMSLSCWKSIGSSSLSLSMTILTAFNGHLFRPHGIVPAFLVQLGENTMEVEVKVVDVILEYNVLVGHNFTYYMTLVVSSIFYTTHHFEYKRLNTRDFFFFLFYLSRKEKTTTSCT
jgi:hypothetical protein